MDKFCNSPFHHININNYGQLRPCCLFRAHPKHYINDDVNTFEQYQTLYDDVKELGLKHPGCDRCKRQEDLGIQSRRKNQFKKDTPPDGYINFIDITFGNTCNLKCRMCRSMNSTKWIADEKYLLEQNFPLEGKIFPKFELSKKKVNEITDYCNNYPGDVFYLEVKGGEPFVTDAFLGFIDGLTDSFKRKCELRVFSNGTKISDEYIEKLSIFKKITYTISIEATGRLYSYIRGSNILTIDEVEQNLINIHKKTKNFAFGTSITTTLYSIFNQLDLVEWAEKMYHPLEPNSFMNFVHSPSYLDPMILPQKYKDQLCELYSKHKETENIVKYLQGPQRYESHKELLQQFFKFTDLLDLRRKESLYDVVPIFKDIKNEL